MKFSRTTPQKGKASTDQSGFTLIELIIAIAIIGIIVAIALPVYGDSKQKGRINAVAQVADSAYKSGYTALNTKNASSLEAVEKAMNKGSDQIGTELVVNPRDPADVCARAYWLDESREVPDAFEGKGCSASDFPIPDTETFVNIVSIGTGSNFNTTVAANTLIGTGEPGATVRVQRGSTLLATTLVTTAGDWTAPILLVPGQNQLTATATDLAGNVESDTRAVQFTPDTSTFVTINSASTSTQAAYQVTGTGEPNSTLTVRRSGVTVGTGTVNASGTWTVQVNLVQGANSLSVTAVDESGNTASASRSVQFALSAPVGSCSVTTTANSNYGNRAIISWASVQGATSYRYEVRRSGNLVAQGEVTESSYTLLPGILASNGMPLGTYPVTVAIYAKGPGVESARSNLVALQQQYSIAGTRLSCG